MQSKTGIAIAMTMVATSGVWAGSDSTCGITTHGIPLRHKATQIDLNKPSLIGSILGAPQVTIDKAGVVTKVWYDIKHIRSGSEQVGSRTDCGVMVAVVKRDDLLQATSKTLQAGEIDKLLIGEVPDF